MSTLGYQAPLDVRKKKKKKKETIKEGKLLYLDRRAQSYTKESKRIDISMKIPKGQVTAFIGQLPGCGKSTLLRCINRMNDLVEGCKDFRKSEASWQECLSSKVDVATLRRRVGILFQL